MLLLVAVLLLLSLTHHHAVVSGFGNSNGVLTQHGNQVRSMFMMKSNLDKLSPNENALAELRKITGNLNKVGNIMTTTQIRSLQEKTDFTGTSPFRSSASQSSAGGPKQPARPGGSSLMGSYLGDLSSKSTSTSSVVRRSYGISSANGAKKPPSSTMDSYLENLASKPSDKSAVEQLASLGSSISTTIASSENLASKPTATSPVAVSSISQSSANVVKGPPILGSGTSTKSSNLVNSFFKPTPPKSSVKATVVKQSKQTVSPGNGIGSYLDNLPSRSTKTRPVGTGSSMMSSYIGKLSSESTNTNPLGSSASMMNSYVDKLSPKGSRTIRLDTRVVPKYSPFNKGAGMTKEILQGNGGMIRGAFGISNALWAGIFALGIGSGLALEYINIKPKDLSSFVLGIVEDGVKLKSVLTANIKDLATRGVTLDSTINTNPENVMKTGATVDSGTNTKPDPPSRLLENFEAYANRYTKGLASKKVPVDSKDLATKGITVESSKKATAEVTVESKDVASPGVTIESKDLSSPGVAAEIKDFSSPEITKESKGMDTTGDTVESQGLPSPEVTVESKGMDTTGVTVESATITSPKEQPKEVMEESAINASPGIEAVVPVESASNGESMESANIGITEDSTAGAMVDSTISTSPESLAAPEVTVDSATAKTNPENLATTEPSAEAATIAKPDDLTTGATADSAISSNPDDKATTTVADSAISTNPDDSATTDVTAVDSTTNSDPENLASTGAPVEADITANPEEPKTGVTEDSAIKANPENSVSTGPSVSTAIVTNPEDLNFGAAIDVVIAAEPENLTLAGVTEDVVISTSPELASAEVPVEAVIVAKSETLASDDSIEKNAPSPILCEDYGVVVKAFDQRVFVSSNPVKVFVAPTDVKPGCILNPESVVPLLKERKLVSDTELKACDAKENAWAYVGDLNGTPQLSCIAKSDDA